MAECRFFPECQRCNETSDSWIPCEGGADGTRCDGYEPMPNVDALEALAREMEGAAGSFGSYEGFSFNRSSLGLVYLAGSVAETYRHVARTIRRSIGDGNGHE